MNTALGTLLHSPLLAQVEWTNVTDFKRGVGTLLAIIILVSFLSAVILWIIGTLAKDSNPGASKWCFQAAWMLAIGVPFISLMFYLFVGGDAVVKPSW